MRHLPTNLAWAAAATAGALGLLQTTRLWWRSTSAARRLRRQSTRARAAEVRAAKLLTSHGYEIIAEQPVASWFIGDYEAVVRADYLVTKGGRKYVAEVKSGEEAPLLSSRSTRRQLLEYVCAFDVEAVLLVDSESGSVDQIQFRLPRDPPRNWNLALLAFIFGASTVVAYVALFH